MPATLVLADLEDPVVLVLNGAVLDAGKGLAELLHDGADLIMARREGDHGLILVDLAHGADNGGGTAQAALYKGAGLDLCPLGWTTVIPRSSAT